MMRTVYAIALALLSLAEAQLPVAVDYSTSFNSSFKLTSSQIVDAQLDNVTAETIEIIMRFDQTQRAFGGPYEDDFYTLPPLTNSTGPLRPGELLKFQAVTDPTAYSIPASTALSRLMYTTVDLNGTVYPATGFILWPFTPRKHSRGGSSKAEVVIWNHGTSGFFPDASPSAHRSLWYDDSAPFALAEAGYAVFAPDYAGLGVGVSWDGRVIPHQYSLSPVTAADGLYGLRAAREAFPEKLAPEFITMGHSQGGGVSWAVAEVLAHERDKFADLLPGYKGSIAGSPTTSIFSDVESFVGSFVVPPILMIMNSIFPEFNVEDWLTPLGLARLKVVREISGSIGAWQRLFITGNPLDTIKPDLLDSWYLDAYAKLGDAGRKDILGPLLVLQGTEDDYVQYNVTKNTTDATWAMFPENNIEFLVVKGVGHVPSLRAAKHVWLQWIEDRFEGKPVAQGGVRTEIESLLPVEQYLHTDNSFPGWAGLPQYEYQVPLAV